MTQFEILKLGQKVELNDGRTGIIRFLGNGSFAVGNWVGVELDSNSGKNDGSVQGERYFDCEPGHGMFLRSSGIGSILDESMLYPSKAIERNASAGTRTKARLQSPQTSLKTIRTHGPGSVDPAAVKRQSIDAASPTPAPSARRHTLLNAGKTGRYGGIPTAPSDDSTSLRDPAPTSARQPARPVSTTAKSNALAGGAIKQKPLTSSNRQSRQTLVAPALAKRTREASASSFVDGPSTGVLPPSASKTSSGAGSGSNAQIPASRSKQMAHEAENDALDAEKDSENDVTQGVISEDISSKAIADSYSNSEESTNSAHPLSLLASSSKRAESKTQTGDRTSRMTAAGRQTEELEARLRLLERKRNDDRVKLARLDQLQVERDKFEKVIQNLQAKYGPQVQEISSLRQRLKLVDDRSEHIDSIKAEHDSLMEMATLDREMAEETADALRAELELLKQKTEELELELEVLREENEELGKEMTMDERGSRGWLQMERSNERLKEALLRLRDVTQTQEQEMKQHILALEHDLKAFDGLQKQHQTTKERLEQSDAAVEDLKQQLEAALNAEDMIEDLLGVNNNLSDEVSRLKNEVEELQIINELNDEFDQQHIENEKQMQAEIDARGAALTQRIASAVRQEAKIADYEHTIGKFRELVNNLQTHLADMKSSQQLTEAEAEGLQIQSKAMADLNKKLQSSATKAMSNALDLEIRRLEAREALEYLNIVQLFLPNTFNTERGSISVYLRFKRIAFKTNILHQSLRDSLQNIPTNSELDFDFSLLDMIDELAWVAAMSERFVGDIDRCSMERFASYEKCAQDLELVERRIIGHIESWKQDNLDGKLTSEELRRSRTLLMHLAELHFVDNLASYAKDIVMQTKLMQSHLETAIMALTCTKSMIETYSARLTDLSNDEDGDNQVAEDGVKDIFRNSLDTMIDQIRRIKIVAGRAFSNVSELDRQYMTFKPDTNNMFSESLESAALLSKQARSLGTHIVSTPAAYANSASLAYRIRTGVRNFHVATFPDIQTPSTPLDGLNSHIQWTSNRLSTVVQLTTDLTQVEEFEEITAPWVLRADALKSESVSNAANESELCKLKDLMQDRLSQLRAKDQAIDEQKIRLELLESRNRDARVESRKIDDLRQTLEQSKKREVELLATLEKTSRAFDDVRDDRDSLKILVDASNVSGDGGQYQVKQAIIEKPIETSDLLEHLEAEVRSLQKTVRYLHQETFEIHFSNQSLATQTSWLIEPLLKSQCAERARLDQQRDILESRYTSIVGSMIQLALTTKVVDLLYLPQQKLAWRPAKQKDGWLVAQQMEDREAWGRSREKLFRHGMKQLGMGGVHHAGRGVAQEVLRVDVVA